MEAREKYMRYWSLSLSNSKVHECSFCSCTQRASLKACLKGWLWPGLSVSHWMQKIDGTHPVWRSWHELLHWLWWVLMQLQLRNLKYPLNRLSCNISLFYFPVTGSFCILWDGWQPVVTKACHRYGNVHGLLAIGSYVNIATRKKKGFVSSFLESWQFGLSILMRRLWISIRQDKHWHFK